MIRRCCKSLGCEKIKPIAYSGSPLHKIGDIPGESPGSSDDLFLGFGELYNGVQYNTRADNIFSYKITGDNKNIYHACGSNGIHVYSLSDFYQNGNLNSSWKIEENSVGADSTFFYGGEGFGYKLKGYLSAGSGASFRYGYEPSQFSAFYDCKVSGQYIVAAKGADGIKLFKLNQEKSGLDSTLGQVEVPGICKHVEIAKSGSLLFIFIGCAKYKKPAPNFSSDAFDIPSSPKRDFTDPSELAQLQVLGWGNDVGKYQYAEVAGYESASTDGFNQLENMGSCALYCLVFDTSEDRFVLKKEFEKEKAVSFEFSKLEQINLYGGPNYDGCSEVSAITFERTSGDGNVANFFIKYGFAESKPGSPVGGAKVGLVSLSKSAAENSSGESVDLFSLSSVDKTSDFPLLAQQTQSILSFTEHKGADFFSNYFDGEQGSQPLSAGGLFVDAGNLGNVFYKLQGLTYDYYGYYGTDIYDLYADYKIDIYSLFGSGEKMVMSIFEGGLFVACRDEQQGSTILDWENFDSLASNLASSPSAVIASLNEGAPSTLSIIDSWSDGQTVFCVDCTQSSTAGGPRTLGLYDYSSSSPGAGSPEALDERRSYIYRNGNGSAAAGGGLVAFSFV